MAKLIHDHDGKNGKYFLQRTMMEEKIPGYQVLRVVHKQFSIDYMKDIIFEFS